MIIQNEYRKLKKKVEKHSEHYHSSDAPKISDTEYDKMFHRLDQIEKEYPELKKNDSPTQKIGGSLRLGLAQVTHKVPMLSIRTETNTDDSSVDAFNQSVCQKKKEKNELSYICELKFDGLAINLRYVDGFLTEASTRGNGETGEDVTENVRTIKCIPHSLNQSKYSLPKIIEIRGEVFITKDNFKILNSTQRLKIENGEKSERIFVNARSAAAGSIRQLDSKVTGERNLSFFAYGLGEVSDWGIGNSDFPKTQDQLLQVFENFGIPVCHERIVTRNPTELVKFYRRIEACREELPFEIDGVVYKVNELETQRNLGYSGREPRWAMAHKFIPQEQVTTLLDIEIHVGRTGKLTPVAKLNPVFVGGTTVSSATLSNENEIIRKDFRLGDTVIVRRAGDVIPELVSVVRGARPERSEPFDLYKTLKGKCPACSSSIVKEDGEWRCLNMLSCPAQFKQLLLHFVSRKAMNIDGFGERLLDQLVKSVAITRLSDLYDLKMSDLIKLDRMGEVSAKKLIAALEVSKHTTLPRFIYSLGIRHVGETTSKILVEHFKDINSIAEASESSFLKIPDIGEATAKSLHSFFSNQNNLSEIKRLLDFGITLETLQENTNKIKRRFEGKAFVITGTFLSYDREKLKELIETQGGVISDAVSKKTNYLLKGNNPKSKYLKAIDLGIPCIDEEEFIKMITFQ